MATNHNNGGATEPSGTNTTELNGTNNTEPSAPNDIKEHLDAPDSRFSEMTKQDLEEAFNSIHGKAIKLSKSDLVSDEALMAKLAVYAIRQLHASNIYPRTAVKAAAIMEDNANKGEWRSTGGAIREAKREVREEVRAEREEERAERGSGEGGEQGAGAYSGNSGGYSGGQDVYTGNIGGYAPDAYSHW